MNIQEGNELIAKFMGYVHSKLLGVYVEPFSSVLPRTNFNVSWDDLMPIISKCVNEYPEMDKHHKSLQNIYNGLMCVNIEQAWSAVIEFIKWHNKINQ